MRINTNINAMTALNQSTKNTALAGNSMAKLSSGLRINKAGDDAAGLVISEKMRAQIRGLDQASENVQDGISMAQTAEGAMEEMGNIAQRMRELAVQASNETNQEVDRNKIQEEMTQLKDQIDNISKSTKFNGQTLLNGSKETSSLATGGKMGNAGDVVSKVKFNGKFANDNNLKLEFDATDKKLTLTLEDAAGGNVLTSQTIDIGDTKFNGTLNFDKVGVELDLNSKALDTDLGTAINNKIAVADSTEKTVKIKSGAGTDDSESITIKIDKLDSGTLGVGTLDVSTTDGAKTAINALDKALEKINTSRANLGAMQNRLEYTDSNLTSTTENLTAAESRIRDVDVAKEMMNLSKLNLLNQASQAMMTQAKSQPEGVMQLLR